jgi:hypothetical protein
MKYSKIQNTKKQTNNSKIYYFASIILVGSLIVGLIVRGVHNLSLSISGI